MEKVKIVKDFLSELKECAKKIVEHNRTLMARLRCRGFNPVTELDFTANKAGVLIHKFFEAVAKFEEGKVPYDELKMLFHTTNLLVDRLKESGGAPVCELEDFGVAFREAGMIWEDTHPEPLMGRDIYLKKHFEAEKEIKKTLRVLHAAYVKKFAVKGKKVKTLSAADVDVNSYDDGARDDRNRIFQEIDRLRRNGYSVTKAIESMRNGSYGSRMKNASVATWRRYYHERDRRNRLEADIKKSVQLPDYTIPKGITSPNEGEMVRLISSQPGITARELGARLGVARSTLMRITAKLKEAGYIVYRGSKKTGGYHIAEKEVGKCEENAAGIQFWDTI